ncbi:MAG TPA: tRNA epoxyqueuosine(34) reductase QueG [Bacteroidota bacterium]|nr:tRNA epoxyqueuosine(34) reductase QueG [Bacteroidota bacterium]
MKTISITSTIKSKAVELGFSKIGIARAAELNEEGAHLREWLYRRYHASMEWMNRDTEKRIDPRNILPSAKSVIAVAANYYSAANHSADSTTGKISRYAWGDDYHFVLTERLEQLLAFIQSLQPDVHGRYYVDAGPVMDKAWAVRAGIGWMGKHTNVISKEFGSWIFLGEIILDVELEYDAPIEDFCGTCTACLEACPTQAIVEPYLLDANKCISYLTIEHRGELPANRMSKFDRWVYGCDICQDVCPWNRFAKETKDQEFKPREENIAPKLTELQNLSQEEFSSRFRRSPIKRTKHSGLTRNVASILESQKTS